LSEAKGMTINMKKSIIISIVLLFTLSLFGTISLIKPKESEATTTYLVGVEAKTHQDITALSKLGYQFNVPAQPAAISPDVAINNAKESFPGLASNTNYIIEYQVLTVPGFNAFTPEALEKNPILKSKNKIDHIPVYIISFPNMLIPVFGQTTRKTSDSSVPEGFEKGEENVIVDAISGVPLMVFSYRN
jgi:hypothetical protein